MVTSEQLRQLKIDPNLADYFNETFDRFDISSPARQACWIGQCGHECGNFRIMEENLNYRAPTLLKLFPRTPKRVWGFTPEEAAAYERQPQRIANRAYANRMGNGDEASGEGWLFRGRGSLQLTGKFNYKAFSDYIGRPDVMTNPDLVAGELCFESALWFFDKNKLWSICDKGINEAAIRELSSRINGSKNPHGLDDRRMKTKKYAAWL